MSHGFYNLEHHVADTIERIAHDREVCGIGPTGKQESGFVGEVRRRFGSVLIELGERVGGPTVRAPQPPAPLSTHTPMFGF